MKSLVALDRKRTSCTIFYVRLDVPDRWRFSPVLSKEETTVLKNRSEALTSAFQMNHWGAPNGMLLKRACCHGQFKLPKASQPWLS